RWCWSRLGGPAEVFAEPTTIDELQTLVQRCRDENVPIRLIGGGSNLLVADAGVSGVVLHLGAPVFGNIHVDKTRIRAGGGASLGHVVSSAVREGLTGLEALVGVPGTVGGAAHGNAGERTSNVGQCIEQATVLTRTGDLVTRERDEMTFAYRESSLDELVIVEVQFELEEDDPTELTRRMQKTWIVKHAAQPSGEKGTLCLFRDPVGVDARELIEQADLRGVSVGGASIYERNANYAIISEDARCQDVLQLAERIRKKVADQTGVHLELAAQVWQ
ncbi:MAG: UDP-N-acetylmuramate dehydrogenase, partial [Planctomycetales bacterium]|nr:UDP-N-acetylmuramate dehydrogenase [Planctomycetales bacterium]